MLLEFDQVVAGYSNPVTAPLSMQLQRGQIVGLAGDNGAGKTTCINLITGTAGARCFSGQMKSATNLSIALLEQNPPPLLRAMPLCGQELLGLIAREKASGAVIPEWARPWLRLRLSLLSGGQLQTLLLLANLARGADLIILDEPTHNLDRRALDLLVLELKRLSANIGVLVVSHETPFLQEIDARLVYLTSRQAQ